MTGPSNGDRPEMSDLYTLDEVADVLRCSLRTVRRIIADGNLRVTWVRGRRRISETELRAYLAGPARRRRLA